MRPVAAPARLRVVARLLIGAGLLGGPAGLRAQGDARRDTAEAGVLLAVLLVASRDSGVIIGATSTWPTMCNDRAIPAFCIDDAQRVRFNAELTDSLRSLLQTAADDFRQRNAEPSVFPDAIIAQAQAAAGPTVPVGGDSCRQPRRLEFTRAGFDADLRHAIAGYTYRAGVGPYPLCGSSHAGAYILQRLQDGSWQVIGRSSVRVTL